MSAGLAVVGNKKHKLVLQAGHVRVTVLSRLASPAPAALLAAHTSCCGLLLLGALCPSQGPTLVMLHSEVATVARLRHAWQHVLYCFTPMLANLVGQTATV